MQFKVISTVLTIDTTHTPLLQNTQFYEFRLCSQYTKGPFIFVLGTRPRQNVLETSSRYTSIQIVSTVKCSRHPFVQILNRHTSRSAQYDLLCIHCATCEVILTCTIRADSGLRAKPRPVRTCSRFHIVQTSFRRHTKGAICSENMVHPCSRWNCSSGNTTL